MRLDNVREGLGKKLLRQPVLLILVTVFLSIGFYTNVWHPTWLILLAIPLYYYVAVKMILPDNKFVRAIPLFLIISLIYVAIGMFYRIWHPTWLIFPVGVIVFWNNFMS